MTDQSLLDELPGEPMIWVLIVSELLVFGAGLAAFMAMRLTDPAGFAEAQSHLHRAGAALNTVVLVTSGLLAALAVRAADAGQEGRKRVLLLGAMALGVVFLVIKGAEYADKAAQGVGWDTHPFFTFYYLLTGFHAAHVGAGILLLGLSTTMRAPQVTETATAFWHMVDLVWVLLFPILYLIR